MSLINDLSLLSTQSFKNSYLHRYCASFAVFSHLIQFYPWPSNFVHIIKFNLNFMEVFFSYQSLAQPFQNPSLTRWGALFTFCGSSFPFDCFRIQFSLSPSSNSARALKWACLQQRTRIQVNPNSTVCWSIFADWFPIFFLTCGPVLMWGHFLRAYPQILHGRIKFWFQYPLLARVVTPFSLEMVIWLRLVWTSRRAERVGSA